MLQKYLNELKDKVIKFTHNDVICEGILTDYNLQEGWIRVSGVYGYTRADNHENNYTVYDNVEVLFNLIFVGNIMLSFFKCSFCGHVQEKSSSLMPCSNCLRVL